MREAMPTVPVLSWFPGRIVLLAHLNRLTPISLLIVLIIISSNFQSHWG